MKSLIGVEQVSDTIEAVKVALAHDYLREYGGAERVLEAIHEIFPEAPVYVASYNPAGLGPHQNTIKNWTIKTSWLQYVPFSNRLVSPFRIFSRQLFESFDLREYDLVISSCNMYSAKAVKVKPGAVHISYIHTPPRALYGFATSFNYKKHWWTRIGGEILNHIMRIDDYEISQRPTVLVANSKNVAERIKKFYRREATVIYPPVNIDTYNAARVVGEGGYFLSVSRLVKGKGVDIIVKACSELKLPLKVVSSGPELEYLQSIAGKSVQFLGAVDDEELMKLYANAGALIVASEDEDFGIVPIESMAAGTPVIAVKRGGFKETVVAGKTGEFFNEATPESLMEVLKSFDHTRYMVEDCQKQAAKFSQERFRKEILNLVESLI